VSSVLTVDVDAACGEVVVVDAASSGSRVPRRRRRRPVPSGVVDRLVVGRHAGDQTRLPAVGQPLSEQRVVQQARLVRRRRRRPRRRLVVQQTAAKAADPADPADAGQVVGRQLIVERLDDPRRYLVQQNRSSQILIMNKRNETWSMGNI